MVVVVDVVVNGGGTATATATANRNELFHATFAFPGGLGADARRRRRRRQRLRPRPRRCWLRLRRVRQQLAWISLSNRSFASSRPPFGHVGAVLVFVRGSIGGLRRPISALRRAMGA